MLRAEELRIGNWLLVQPSDESTPTEYKKIDDLDITRIYTLDDKDFAYYPIPITKKLLTKIGFIGGPNYILGDFIVVYILPGKIHYQGTIVSHLHHLQNLYYSLRGKELPIAQDAFSLNV